MLPFQYSCVTIAHKTFGSLVISPPYWNSHHIYHFLIVFVLRSTSFIDKKSFSHLQYLCCSPSSIDANKCREKVAVLKAQSALLPPSVPLLLRQISLKWKTVPTQCGGKVWKMISSSHKVKKVRKYFQIIFPKPHDTADLSAIVTSHTVQVELGAVPFKQSGGSRSRQQMNTVWHNTSTCF